MVLRGCNLTTLLPGHWDPDTPCLTKYVCVETLFASRNWSPEQCRPANYELDGGIGLLICHTRGIPPSASSETSRDLLL